MTETSKPAAPDWERIKVSYRAGLLSLREIAGGHGIVESAICKRAKRDGWTRDLEGKVRAKADDLVRKTSVRSLVRSETRPLAANGVSADLRTPSAQTDNGAPFNKERPCTSESTSRQASSTRGRMAPICPPSRRPA